MAVTVEDIRQQVFYLLNKHQSGNTLNGAEFNQALKFANLSFFKRRYGLPESYRPGMPLPAISYEVTQLIIDGLSPFKVTRGGRDYPVITVDKNGWAALPPDYIHASSITYNVTPVEILRDSQFQDRLNNSITFPSKKDPICSIHAGYIQFQPTDLGSVNMVYLRLPVTPVWGYTITNDEEVYNAATSVQPEWNDVDMGDFVNIIVEYASNNLKDAFTKQAADSKIQNGI